MVLVSWRIEALRGTLAVRTLVGLLVCVMLEGDCVAFQLHNKYVFVKTTCTVANWQSAGTYCRSLPWCGYTVRCLNNSSGQCFASRQTVFTSNEHRPCLIFFTSQFTRSWTLHARRVKVLHPGVEGGASTS